MALTDPVPPPTHVPGTEASSDPQNLFSIASSLQGQGGIGIGTGIGAPADTPATNDTSPWSLVALFKRLLQLIDGIISGTSPATVRGNVVRVSAEIIRSSDGAAAYAANQVMGAAAGGADIVLVGAARVNGGTGTIFRARCMKNSATTALAQFRLHLYHVAGTFIADRAAKTMLYANVAKRDGTIDFLNFITSGAGSDSAVASGQFQQGMASFLPFRCDPASKDLVLNLETLAAYVPISGEKYTFDFLIIQD